VVEHLPSQHEALRSKPSTTEKINKENKNRKNKEGLAGCHGSLCLLLIAYASRAFR
jgi:hypothetical protein